MYWRQEGDKTYRPHSRRDRAERESYETRFGGVDRNISYGDSASDISVVGIEPPELNITREELVKPVMAKQDDFTAMMQMMIQMRQDDKEREDRRLRNQADKDEKRLREQNQREERLLAQMQVNARAVPQAVTVQQCHLPKMGADQNVEDFIASLETALDIDSVVEDAKRKKALLSQLTPTIATSVNRQLRDTNISYQEVKDILLSRSVNTVVAAREALWSDRNSPIKDETPQQAIMVIQRWYRNVIGDAIQVDDIIDRISIPALRAHLDKDLKTFIDWKEPANSAHLTALIDQWKLTQGGNKSIYKQTRASSYTKKSLNCFHCGKPDHFSKDCRSKGSDTTKVDQTTSPHKETKPIRCFACGELGHKSNVCPKKKDKLKRLTIPWKHVRELGYSDIMGKVNGVTLPITMDSGADVSLVPIEAVKQSDYTGETSGIQSFIRGQIHREVPIVNITLEINGETLTEKAGALLGEDLDWTAVYSARTRNNTNMERFQKAMILRESMADDQIRFIPPKVDKGTLKGAVLLSEKVVEEQQGTCSVCATQEPQIPVVAESLEPVAQQTEAAEVQNEVDKELKLGDDLVLAETTDVSLVLDEESKEDVTGSTNREGNMVDEGNTWVDTPEEPVDIMSDVIGDSPSRTKLVLGTQQDATLKTITRLAKNKQEGYSEVEGLMFRDRLDNHGEVIRQLCVPKELRHHCLNLAHDGFGHRGRNKVYKDISSHFYWPSMSVDVAEHVRSCHTCQMQSKIKPKPNPMKEREILTEPS